MEKIFNRTVLIIVVGVYLVALFIGIYMKLSHLPYTQITMNIIFYLKILFYAYLLIYAVYYLSKLSKSRNK